MADAGVGGRSGGDGAAGVVAGVVGTGVTGTAAPDGPGWSTASPGPAARVADTKSAAATTVAGHPARALRCCGAMPAPFCTRHSMSRRRVIRQPARSHINTTDAGTHIAFGLPNPRTGEWAHTARAVGPRSEWDRYLRAGRWPNTAGVGVMRRRVRGHAAACEAWARQVTGREGRGRRDARNRRAPGTGARGARREGNGKAAGAPRCRALGPAPCALTAEGGTASSVQDRPGGDQGGADGRRRAGTTGVRQRGRPPGGLPVPHGRATGCDRGRGRATARCCGVPATGRRAVATTRGACSHLRRRGGGGLLSAVRRRGPLAVGRRRGVVAVETGPSAGVVRAAVSGAA